MDAEIFRQNLRELLRTKGLKQKDLAKKSGVSYSWIRKVCSQGLTRVEDRNRDKLEKVCQSLGISPVEKLWSPKLVDQQDEASTYASKVEELLRATRTDNNFNRYESVREHSVVDLVDQIDEVHGALADNRETIEQRQRRQVEASRHPRKSQRPSQPSEYAEKIRSLIRDDRPELRAVVAAILRLIDGAYYHDEGKKLEQRLKKERPDAHKRWLSSFGGNVNEVVGELATASSGRDDDEILERMATQEPSGRSEAMRLLSELLEHSDEVQVEDRYDRKSSKGSVPPDLLDFVRRAAGEKS